MQENVCVCVVHPCVTDMAAVCAGVANRANGG